MKKLLIAMVAMIAVASYAADNTGQESGITKPSDSSRWRVFKAGSEAVTGTLATTNVITTQSAVLGKIVFIPGFFTDTMKFYNASSGATAASSNLVLELAISPIFGMSTSLTPGQQIYDLTPGWSATTGITVISTRASISTALKAYIGWDNAR